MALTSPLLFSAHDLCLNDTQKAASRLCFFCSLFACPPVGTVGHENDYFTTSWLGPHELTHKMTRILLIPARKWVQYLGDG